MKLNFLFCVPGMPFDGDTLEKASLGGSETAGLCLVRELSRLGHKVHMFCNTRGGSWDGVNYHPLERFLSVAKETPSDVVVIQRAPELFSNAFASKLNILWQHDLAQGRMKQQFSGVLWNVDRVALLSNYMIQQYNVAVGMPTNLAFRTRNGIDLDLFSEPENIDRKRIVYAARPERGLDVLVGQIMPELLKRDPEIGLVIAGYDNPVSHLQGFYAEIMAQAKAVGAQHLGHLTKRELYQLYTSSGCYVYPTPSPTAKRFAEISCITAMECQAAGLPFVSSARGALPETLAHGAGTLIDDDPWTQEYIDAFCDAVIRYVNDEDGYATKARQAGKEAAIGMSWTGVAEEWAEECERAIREKSADPIRLARHFMRRSDIVTAQEVVKDLDSVEAQIIRGAIQRDYGWMRHKDETRAHYQQIGETHGGNWEDHSQSPRYQAIKTFVERQDPGVVIDFGCAYGFHTIPMANAMPETQFVGVDIDPVSLEHAKRYSRERGNLVTFREGDEDYDPKLKADGLIVDETLEHLPDPAGSLRKLERWVKPGGWVHITVPYGAWEEMSYHSYPHRCHLWEISQADINDMIGHRENFELDILPAGRNSHDNTPLGWLIASYKVDGQEVGEIDMHRKLALQAPRQSLSVIMIAGPECEETLHWTLRSVQFVADEIVIADCGMSEEAKQIAKHYSARLLPAPDPMTAGFEVPRNEALAHARCDWCLWIDTDEKLLNPNLLSKYLRPNCWNGYGIRQHHFTVDAEFKPDMPVRLFRNAPRDGKRMRFYGCVTPDTLVTTNPGLRRIDEIEIGDFVRTHDGSYGRVDKLWQYDIDDEILEINAVGMPRPLRITKDHKLLVIRTEKCHYDHEYNVRCKPICQKQTHKSGCPHRFHEHYHTEWIPANDVRVGDLLLHPVDNSVIDRETVAISDHAPDDGRLSWNLTAGRWSGSRWNRYIADQLDVDGDLLRFIGYYISDGVIDVDHGKVTLNFGSHETINVSDIINAAKRWGLEATKYSEEEKHVIKISVCCRPFAEWIEAECGKLAGKKKLPLWVMRLPFDKQEQLLTALWRGDGNVSGSLVRYATINEELAAQVQDLLLRQGICANYRWGKASKCYEVFARVKRRKFLDWDMPKDGANVPSQAWSDDRYMYMRVKSVKPVHYAGPVYDIRVPGNHSFVFGRIAGANSLHEHPELEMNKGPGPIVVLSDVHIAHLGYLTEQVRQRRFERNWPLLRMDIQKYPDRMLQKHFICRDNMLLAQLALQRNGGRVTQQVVDLCEEVVEIYRKHFLGRPHYINIETGQYHSDALRVLGRGVDVNFSVEASKEGPANGGTLRFETEEEAVKEITWRTKNAVGPYLAEDW